MKKRNLKAIFLGLLARRRSGGQSSPDLAAAGTTQDGAAGRSQDDPASSDKNPLSVYGDLVNATAGQPLRKLPGPPADWLAKRSSAPPPHWAERVRLGAPELLQDREWNEAGPAAPKQPPEQVQLKPAKPAPQAPGPPQAQRLSQAPPLRLQRPALAPRSMPEPRQSKRGDGYSTPDSGTISKILPHRRLQTDSGRQEIAPIESSRTFAPEPRVILTGDGRGAESQPAIVQRRSETEPNSPAGLVQPGRGGDKLEFSRVEPVASSMTAHHGSSDEHDALPNNPVHSADRAQEGKFFWRQNSDEENVAQKSVSRYPDVIRRESRRFAAGHHHRAFKPGYRRVAERQEEVMKPIGPQAAQDRPAASYGVSADRWPALFEASPDDYFDEVTEVWRELDRTRRLSREQAGDLWSE